MFNQEQLNAALYVVLGVLAVVALFAGVLAALKSFQVKQFQDLLFKAERKIDNLERRMFNVLNAVPVALVETDTTGKFTFANKAAHLLLGRKDSELIGLRFHAATWGIAYPDGRQVPPDLMPIARTLRGQTVKGFQHLLTKYGSTDKVMVSVTSMPILNNMGEVIGATAALVEIETETGEGIDDLTGLWRGHWFAAATVPFWGLDGEGRILDINHAALDAFDLKREQAIGQHWARIFVADGDYQAALDYLGDARDENDPHSQTSIRLGMKGGEGNARPALVTAWAVRTHEGGDAGLTVMAMASAGQEDMIAVQPDATPAAAPSRPLSEDDQLELEDFRAAERTLATLGVGTWQYDPLTDAIVEDAGMQALIGREVPGGPTLISDADQALADAAFQKIMSGETDRMALDLRIDGRDGRQRWITLKGQADVVDGERQILGVAFDCTEWKSAQPAAEAPVADAPQADLDSIRAEARDQALAEVRTSHEAELASLKAEHAEALAAVAVPAAVTADHALEPENIYDRQPVPAAEPDPAVVAENADLKARIDSLTAELAAEKDTTAALQGRLDDMAGAPVAESGAGDHEAHIAALETELAGAQAAHRDARARLDEVLSAPPAEPDFSVHDARIEDLQDQLARAEAAQKETQAQLDELAARPVPEPDYSGHEARIAALMDDLRAAGAAHAATRAELDELASRPAPQPDYSRHEARIAAVQADLDTARDERNGWKARYEALAAAPPPDTSDLENKLAATQFDLVKWQAAHRDLQQRLEEFTSRPVVDHQALEGRIAELQESLERANIQQAQTEARLDQLHASLSHAQRFETVGRLTGDVAQDFAQMLNVINNALEVMSRQQDTPDSVRRLSEAALAAGRRGERLTRQLQAFQSEEF